MSAVIISPQIVYSVSQKLNRGPVVLKAWVTAKAQMNVMSSFNVYCILLRMCRRLADEVCELNRPVSVGIWAQTTTTSRGLVSETPRLTLNRTLALLASWLAHRLHKLTRRQSVFISDLGSFNMASIFSNRPSMFISEDIFLPNLVLLLS